MLKGDRKHITEHAKKKATNIRVPIPLSKKTEIT
jgi:hypothetical protein